MQERRGAQFWDQIQFVAGYGLLAVIHALTGAGKHFLDFVLRCIRELFNQFDAVRKADLCLVSFAGAAPGLV